MGSFSKAIAYVLFLIWYCGETLGHSTPANSKNFLQYVWSAEFWFTFPFKP